MKKNFGFIILVVCLILSSSLLLTGGMSAIANDMGSPKQYNLTPQSFSDSDENNVADGESVNRDEDFSDDSILNDRPEMDKNVIEDAPASQTEMREKFDKYLHKNGNTVTIFTKEQYAALKSLRNNEKRNPLTYDEVLYLINDSINLYFTYNDIILTNSNIDNSLPKVYHEERTASHIVKSISNINLTSSSEAQNEYIRMLYNIYEIIYYRIYVHDAGFDGIHECVHAYGDTVVFAEDMNFGEISSIVSSKKIMMLSFNDGEISGKENRFFLAKEWGKLVESRKSLSSSLFDEYTFKELVSPLIFTHNQTEGDVICSFYVVDPKTHKKTKVFPTHELEAMEPASCDTYTASGSENCPYFYLDERTGRFSMGFSELSFAIVGKYINENGVLTLFPENAGKNTEGTVCYVFTSENGEWAYSKEKSTPIDETYDFKNGLHFRCEKAVVYKSFSRKPIQSIRDYSLENNILTPDALECFYEDESFKYYFPSIKSQYVIVTFGDGEAMTVKDALTKRYISIIALDIYGIKYSKEKQ